MGSARSKGTLKKWLDDKGYGFITPDKGTKDIFVHISAFDRGIPRKPRVGDTIYFYVKTDNNNKSKAVDAAIEGAAPVKRARSSKPKRSYQGRTQKSSWRFFVLCLALIIGIGSTVYQRFQPSGTASNFVETAQSQKFTCSGKTHCSQMTSCAEATFYIRNCPDTKMDGDGDGVPCERQFCN